METPRTAAKKLDAYLQTCEGTATNALRGAIFPVFVDDNAEALMRWLCEFNQAHPADPVHLYGFDAQQPVDDKLELEAALTAMAPADEPMLMQGIATCSASQDPNAVYPQASYDSCITGLDTLDGYIATHRAALVAASEETQVHLLEVAALSFRSWQPEWFFYTSDVYTSYEVRDVAMTKIFLAERDLFFPDKRAVIWAHNYHLMAAHRDVVGDVLKTVATFGQGLHDAVGDDYFPVGFTAQVADVNWPGIPNGLPPSDNDSLTDRLHKLGRPYLIADTHAPFVGQYLQVFAQARDGAMIPSAQYGAVVYFNFSPGMNALFW
jgi:erythromycin esterase-like protein